MSFVFISVKNGGILNWWIDDFCCLISECNELIEAKTPLISLIELTPELKRMKTNKSLPYPGDLSFRKNSSLSLSKVIHQGIFQENETWKKFCNLPVVSLYRGEFDPSYSDASHFCFEPKAKLVESTGYLNYDSSHFGWSVKLDFDVIFCLVFKR